MDKETMLLDRRDFLRGATALGIAATLGLETKSEAAASSAAPALTTLAFWSTNQFLNPAALSGSDVTFSGRDARVKIHAHFVPTNTKALLHVLKVHFAVLVNGQVEDIPVYAWVATNQASKNSALTVPVSPGNGIEFSIELNTTPSSEATYFLAAGQSQGQAKLQAGTYVIAAGNPNWQHCLLTEDHGTSAIVRSTVAGNLPADFEYLLVTVSHVSG